MFTRSSRLSALALVLLVGLPACRPAEELGSEQRSKITRAELVIAARGDLSSVNELLSSSAFDHEIRTNLFLPLLREQPDYQNHPPTYAPALATGYEFSDDRLQLTFELRDDVTWSDGTPVTAEDVRWTWQAQTHPDVGWAYASAKESIEDVEVVDDHTVVFHFDAASPTQLIDANEGFVLPRHAWSELDFEAWPESADWFAEHLVVNGPYTIERWDRGQELVLVRNEGYAEDGLPAIGRVVFRIIPDETARLSQLLAGEVDVMAGIPPERASELTADPAIALFSYQARQYTFLVWNTANDLFANPEVRRALTMAIDRDALVDTLWFGHAVVGVSPVLRSVWAHDDSLEPWPYDPEAIGETLTASGWSRGEDGIYERDGTRFSFELTTNTGNQLRRDALVLMQEQLARAGVEATPRFVDGQSLISLNLGHLFDVTLGAWAIDTSLDVSYAFHSREIDGGYNYGAYSNPEVDRLLDAISAEADPDAAKVLFDELQTLLHEDQPYTFLWEPQALVGINARVKEASPNALLTFQTLERWRIE